MRGTGSTPFFWRFLARNIYLVPRCFKWVSQNLILHGGGMGSGLLSVLINITLNFSYPFFYLIATHDDIIN